MVKVKMLTLFNVIGIIIVAISSGALGFLLTAIVDDLENEESISAYLFFRSLTQYDLAAPFLLITCSFLNIGASFL